MGQALAARIFTGQAQAVAGGGAPDGPNNPDATWWCKLLARIVGTVGGILALILSIFVIILIHPLCIISGLLIIFAAIVVLVFEAPICCTFVEFTKPIAAFAEHRTYFQKAIIYVVLAIIPFALCIGLASFFACGPIFAAGVIYGIMGLGRKADREQMMTAASATDRPRGGDPGARPDDTRVGLIENEDAVMRGDPSPYLSGQSFPK